MLEAARMQILRAIEAGEISAREGARLLDALAGGGRATTVLCLRVVDLAAQKTRLEVVLSLEALRICARLRLRLDSLFGAGEAIDAANVLSAVEGGAEGVVAEVIDEKSRQRVQVLAERR